MRFNFQVEQWGLFLLIPSIYPRHVNVCISCVPSDKYHTVINVCKYGWNGHYCAQQWPQPLRPLMSSAYRWVSTVMLQCHTEGPPTYFWTASLVGNVYAHMWHRTQKQQSSYKLSTYDCLWLETWICSAWDKSCKLCFVSLQRNRQIAVR